MADTGDSALPGRHHLPLAIRRHGLPRLPPPHEPLAPGRQARDLEAGRSERAGRARVPQGPRARGGLPAVDSSTTGRRSRTIALEPDHDWERATRETIDAMHEGVDVVYQGVLASDGWRGVADFLMRVETPSALGRGATRRSTRSSPATRSPPTSSSFASTASSSRGSRSASRRRSTCCSGTRERESFAPGEFGAYYRRVCARLEQFVAEPPVTEPFPCAAVRHLRLQAALRRALGRGRPPLAGGGHQPRPDREARDARRRNAGGARRRRSRRPARPASARTPSRSSASRPRSSSRPARSGVDDYVILPPQPSSGFALLPDPSPGDLFFDFEGNPFWDERRQPRVPVGHQRHRRCVHRASGRRSRRGARRVRAIRRRLFTRASRCTRDLHVYHYAQYEITALRRLMGRYGTREDELDDLLRRGVFVDLYKVVRGGVARLAPRLRAEGDGGVARLRPRRPRSRTAAPRSSSSSAGWQTRDQAILDGIAAYNREDCIATRVLRDWLLERRAEALATLRAVPAARARSSRSPSSRRRPSGLHLREVAARHRDHRERTRGAAPRLPRPRAQAGLVGVLRQARAHPGGAARGLGGDRRPQPDRRAASRRRSRSSTRSRTRRRSRRSASSPFDHATTRSAGEIVEPRPRCSHARAEARPLARRGAAAAGAPPGRPVQHRRAGGRRSSGSAARCSRATAAIRRSSRCSRREPFDRDVQTNDLDEMTELLLSLDGRHLVIQGPPGSGKTWTSRAG